MIIALAGRRIDAPEAEAARFPLDNAAIVSQRIGALFTEKKPEALVCAAACGADLLALEVARKHAIRRRIVLPFDSERFRASSVVDRPGEWSSIFDRQYKEVAEQGDVVTLPSTGDDASAFIATNEKIIEEALILAAQYSTAESVSSPSKSVIAVIVWNGTSRGEDDVTAGFAKHAQALGIPVVEISTL